MSYLLGELSSSLSHIVVTDLLEVLEVVNLYTS